MDELSEQVPKSVEIQHYDDTDISTYSGGTVSLRLDRYKKFQTFDCEVDPNDGNRSRQVKLFSAKRPHMRAFWCSNVIYRATILLWFSVNPLLFVMQESVGISTEAIWSSTISTLLGSLITRLIAGPICDKYGARLPFAFFLLATCIPTLCIGFVQTNLQLIIVRFFVGIGGGSFVMCHFWLEDMFTKECSGFLHGFSGGIGPVVGLTQFCIGVLSFPICTEVFGSKELGWRLALIPPIVVTSCIAFYTIFYSDDTPSGNYSKLKRINAIPSSSFGSLFRAAIRDRNVWLIACQYGVNFGAEITLYNTLVLFFQDKYGMGVLPSSVISGAIGMANQILRVVGGKISDRSFGKFGMKARVTWQTIFIILMGFFFAPFAAATNLVAALTSLAFIVLFMSCAQGALFGLVPLVNRSHGGAAIGIIGASGNIGAIAFILLFRQFSYRSAFNIMGVVIMISSFLSFFIHLPGLNDFKLCGGGKEPESKKFERTNSANVTACTESMCISAADSTTLAKIYSREIGKKMAEGWILCLNSTCNTCSVPMLSASMDGKPICLSCGPISFQKIKPTTSEISDGLSSNGTVLVKMKNSASSDSNIIPNTSLGPLGASKKSNDNRSISPVECQKQIGQDVECGNEGKARIRAGKSLDLFDITLENQAKNVQDDPSDNLSIDHVMSYP